MKRTWIGLGLGICLAIAPLANADTIDFTTASDNTGSESPPNSLCYSSTGASTSCSGNPFLTVTGWGITGGTGGDTTFVQAALGTYYGANLGLGVCNQDDGADCPAPNHEIDNANHVDFVLFQFSSPLTAVSVVLNPVCDCGFTDSTYYVGNATASIAGESLAGLGSIGFGSPTDTPGGNSQQILSLAGVSGGVSSILIGADVGGANFGDDYFKIGSLTYGSTNGDSPVPEPSSLTSLAGGLGLVVWLARRRRAKKA